jgi:hypothetical protein
MYSGWDDRGKWGSYQGLAEWDNVRDEVWPRQLEALRRTRENAATEQGVEWNVYLDYDKDLPPALTATQLREQFQTIEAYGDRTKVQKDYLRNKAATRFTMQKLGHEVGYGRTMFDNLHAGVPARQWKAFMDPQNRIFEENHDYVSKMNFLPTIELGAPDDDNAIYYVGYKNIWNIVHPQSHYDEGAVRWSPINSIPPWQNKNEAGLASWIDLSPQRRRQEDMSKDVFNAYYDHRVEEIGYSPDDVLQEKGTKLEDESKLSEDQRQAQIDIGLKRYLDNLRARDVLQMTADRSKLATWSPVISAPKMRGETSREDWYLKRMAEKKERRAAHKAYWKGKLKTVHERKTTWEQEEEGEYVFTDQFSVPGYHYTKTGDLVKDTPPVETYEVDREAWETITEVLPEGYHYDAEGNVVPDDKSVVADKKPEHTEYVGDMTYEKFLEFVNDPTANIESILGEPSIVNVYEKFLTGKYDWAPSNKTLNEYNLPKGYLQGREESFKPMLQKLNPSLRQAADRLHNQVHKPDTEEYIEKYHHQAGMTNPQLAKDMAGTTELFSDWNLHYEKRMNQVKFNNHIHSQMSFGVSETV